MRHTGMHAVVMMVLGAVLCGPAFGQGSAKAGIAFCCSPNNDLFRLLNADGETWTRFETPSDAVRFSPPGYGVLILADQYPDTPVDIPTTLLDDAAAKGLRLYIEFPQSVMGVYVGTARDARWERVVVASGFFGNPAPLTILSAHDCRFTPLDRANPSLSLIRVAGYDKAAFPLPESEGPRSPEAKVFPILIKHPLTNALIAGTKLSNISTGRYAPMEQWRLLWQGILQWVAGKPFEMRSWMSTVYPSYGSTDMLPETAERDAMRKAADWYQESRMLVHPDWANRVQEMRSQKDQIGPPLDADYPVGDGKLGILEGFTSAIDPYGRQPVRYWVRADCVSESAMAMALTGIVHGDQPLQQIASSLQDYLYFDSLLAKGPRAEPRHPSYGLLGWNTDAGLGVYYGDDNARAMLATMAATAVLKTDRWEESLIRSLLANLRTTGKSGFRGNSLNEDILREKGWRAFYDSEPVNIAPHYEAYLWACYLWGYKHTGFQPFLERAKAGITRTMAEYPSGWRWTNGMQQERARMLLPLAWLVRVEDTEEHRGWIKKIAQDLLRLQDGIGGIREELGAPEMGQLTPPKSHEEYGVNESPVIQQDGDPACDLLYTLGFAFLGLHEAAEATGDQILAEAEKRLSSFLCRVQARSPIHNDFDGGWYRGFDLKRWDFWGSSGDAGWGVWALETGWHQAWIPSVMALRQLKTSLWDMTLEISLEKYMQKMEPLMFTGGGPVAPPESQPAPAPAPEAAPAPEVTPAPEAPPAPGSH